jgi:1,4-alpha-glucan branching enzyme
MKKSALFFFFLACQLTLLGQVVTTIPVFPTADREVTLIFDLARATDGRARGLLNKTNDVYLWSGAGTSATGDAWQYQPPGQRNFSVPFPPGAMTWLGNNRWQIRLVPRTYFQVPAGQPIRRLGLLLKNGAGTAQTEDFFVTIYEDKFLAAFLEPEQQHFFVDAYAPIPIRAAASAPADLSLRVNDSLVLALPASDQMAFSLAAGAAAGVRKRVVLEARTATETAADTFYYTVKPQPVVAEPPAGTREGINYLAPDRVVLSLFAPHKSFVYVIGEFNNWTASPGFLMKRTADGNRYWLELTGLPAGQEVAFQYLVDGSLAVADPYTHKILDPENDPYLKASYPGLKAYPPKARGIVSVLQTNQPPYDWKVSRFRRPDPENLVVYEMLVRDFVATRNYRTLADTLSYLKRLGINAIELMPVMEFTGNDSWGYNPIFYFAPDKAYGTSQDLKAFIDKCHENGIAVILDLVLNQADYEFPYVKMYWDGTRPAANSPYFNPEATHPYSVFFDFNHEQGATQALVERVSRYWIEEYKVDGYRFDLSKGFTQKKSGNSVDSWSAYDAGRVATWKRIYQQIRSVDSTAYVILEHFADNAEEKELADTGMMFWGNLNHAYRQGAKGHTANNASNFDWISYQQRDWQRARVLGYLESHDEERLVFDVRQNGRSGGSYDTRDLATALDRAKLAAAFFLPVPGPKLLWQFGELGYDVSIDENGRTGAKPIRWDYLQQAGRRQLYDLYAELNKLKLTYPVFKTSDFTLSVEGAVKSITLRDPAMTVFVLGNFDVQPQQVPAGFPVAGIWYDYFSGQPVEIGHTAARISLQPGEFHLYTNLKLPAAKPGLVPWTQAFTSVTARPDDLLSQQVKVYPNPAGEQALLEWEDSYRGKIQIEVNDLNGRVLRMLALVKTTHKLSRVVSLQGLAPGVYLLQVRWGEARVVKKVVKL